MTDDSMMIEINNGHPLYNILRKYGLKAIPALKNANADFTSLSGSEIYSIAAFTEDGDNGYELLLSLKEAGAKLDSMTGSILYSIISSMDERYRKGQEVIKLLNEEKADFNTLSDSELYSIASVEENSTHTQLENLEFLKGMGFNFGLLSTASISSLVYHGKDKAEQLEIFQWFKNDDALKDREIFDSAKLDKIKALCQPILEENVEKIKAIDSLAEELFQKYNIFEIVRDSNVNDLDKIHFIIESHLPKDEISRFISDPDKNIDSEIDINGNSVDEVEYLDNRVFHISQGKLIDYYSKVVTCLYDIRKLFAKHGINLREQTDAELELEYIRLDFNDKSLGYHNCTAYGQMIGLNNTMIAQYCPDEQQANVVGETSHPEL